MISTSSTEVIKIQTTLVENNGKIKFQGKKVKKKCKSPLDPSNLNFEGYFICSSFISDTQDCGETQTLGTENEKMNLHLNAAWCAF